MKRLAVYSAQELLEAERERREPVAEAVVDEWPKRSAVRMIERPRAERDEGGE